MQRYMEQATFWPARRRGGAVIILSLALLMTLLFLGLFFFNFIDDESLSADVYARQFQGDTAITGNAQVLNHGLDQVIVGTNDSDPGLDHYARYSALFGGRYSLLAHILGTVGEHDWNRNGMLDPAEDLNGNGSFDPWMPRNFEPYSGSGIRIYYDSTLMQFVADTDGDGTADLTDLTNLALNGSELAGGTMTAFEPNAGYTYPDLNSLFLYHELKDPSTGLKAIKPSFDAPGIMYAPANYTGPHLYSQERVLRPHPQHQIAGQPRYLTSATTAQSGDTTRTIPPFEPQYLNDPTQMGIWSGSGNNNYDLHVDADGDGTNDAWLMDLDYPLITFPDGRQAVPLFFFRIEDLDALVNLNSAGDMPLLRLAERYGGATRAQVLNALLNATGMLTGGNFGWSPSEINPGVALFCDPDPGNPSFIDNRNQALALDQYQRYFNEQAGIGSASMDRLTLANTELLWLMTGRHQYDQSGNVLPESTYDLAGRYGETRLLDRTKPLLPAPGSTSIDDDQDSNQGRRPGGGARYQERFYAKNGAPTTSPPGVPVPPAVHPLDATGLGQWLENAPGSPSPGRRQLRESASNIGYANNPSRWPKYDTPFWQHQGGAAGGVSPYFTAAGGNTLQLAGSLDALTDEPDEVVLDDSDASFPNPDDQPFGASEITALHASDSDWSGLARTSRLRKLAPVNFEINYRASEIRRRFTVLSWDRPEFGFAKDNRRSWEFNDAWTDPTTGQTVNLFPPQFGSVTPSRHAQGTLSANDPLRPEVRRLLTIEFTNPQENAFPQHPLLLNGILSDDSVAGGAACFDNNGNPRFRPLVPHPVFDSATDPAFTPPAMIHDHTVAPPFSFASIGNSKAAQEWWARYDRQRLARDVYTLLWVMGAKQNAVASNPYTTANGYPDLDGDGVADVIKEMAQFAVNVVDAMDHDHVITRFEYDPDLSNGWTWTAGVDPVVHGVEAQGLTFSEALWINSKQVTDGMGNPADHPATLYDDATGDRHFLFIELRNALPFTIPVANDTYRIRRLENGAEVAKLTFDGTLATATGNYQVGPGANYLIGTHSGSFQVVGGPDDGKNQAAIFWLDHQVDGGTTPTNYDYYQQVPYLTSTVRPQGPDLPTARQAYPSPLCDLDLCHDRDRVTQPRFVEATSGAGYFLASLAGSGVSTFELVLERRQNMQGDGLIADAANDWVEVDRIRVNEQQFQLNRNDSHTVTRSQLGNLRSQERREPFFVHPSADRSAAFAGANAVLKHSLGGPNIDDTGTEPYATTGPIDGGIMIAAPIDNLKHQRNSLLPQDSSGAYQFQIVQPHFDRGFTSLFDLLSVPLIGPAELIYRRTTPTVEGGLVDVGSTRLTGINTAGVRFVHPQQPSALPAHLSGISDLAARHYENRWYRLFSVLAVPSHTSDEVADEMTLRRRIPGRVNLNTLRYEEVLGAVINDANQLWLVHGPNGERPTHDRFMAARNWYDELRRTRDGDDGSGNILPPGTPFARPLRPFTFDHPDFDPTQATRAQANNPVDDTLLRVGFAPPAMAPTLADIGLFEARSPTDVTNDAIDYYTRQRILSRVSNLTTNRSHVFVIWAGFQLHEAHDWNPSNPNNPQVQIGGRMPANEFPTYRELLVVDMSRLEEAYDPANEKFNFEAFIVHREVLP